VDFGSCQLICTRCPRVGEFSSASGGRQKPDPRRDHAHFAKDERAYIASERFLFLEEGLFLFLVVTARAAHIVLETALSSYSRPFLVIVTTLSPVKLTGRDTIKRSRSPSSLVATSAFMDTNPTDEPITT
jgi:hypothetical protein